MRVTGPLSLAELDESIRARHFTMLDEACPSLGRWRYIREIPELHAAVEVARTKMDWIVMKLRRRHKLSQNHPSMRKLMS